MNNQDPIADMLTRIRNANRVGRRLVVIPRSKVCAGIAQVLKDEGYIEEYDLIDDASQGQLTELDAADLELAVHRLGAPGQGAPIVLASGAGVAGELRQRGVVLFLLELPADLGVLRDEFLTAFLFGSPGFSGHM